MFRCFWNWNVPLWCFRRLKVPHGQFCFVGFAAFLVHDAHVVAQTRSRCRGFVLPSADCRAWPRLNSFYSASLSMLSKAIGKKRNILEVSRVIIPLPAVIGSFVSLHRNICGYSCFISTRCSILKQTQGFQWSFWGEYRVNVFVGLRKRCRKTNDKCSNESSSA